MAAKTKEISAFGKKLEFLLNEKNMSDTDLAKILKVAPPQVFLLKRTKKPREKTLKKLSDKLNKPMKFWQDVLPAKEENKNGRLNGKKSALSNVKVYLVVECDGVEQKILLR